MKKSVIRLSAPPTYGICKSTVSKFVHDLLPEIAGVAEAEMLAE